nr:extracellular solute-binding protein [Cohnella sp. WQ 127256]
MTQETQEISYLTVEVALVEKEFNALFIQNEEFKKRHPDILVQMRRIEPSQAYSVYKLSSKMEQSADIMLLPNEWVKEFASSGFLLPADAAFVGKALAEQFDALAAPLKWNGYMWGVPRDMDPYVVVWNKDMLQEWLGENVIFPLSIEQWTTLADMSVQSQGTISWLSLDGNDPFSLLAWLENVANERSDGLLDTGTDVWNGTIFEQALLLLDQYKANINFVGTEEISAQLLKDRATIMAIVPYSIAAKWNAVPRLDSEPKLEIDHQFWKLPFVWPRGNSFVISANTKVEEAANVWISEMTEDLIQLQNMDETGKLPVYRALYDSDRTLSNLLSGRSSQAFPNQAPLQMGPDLAERLKQIGILWARLSSGNLTIDEWKSMWSGISHLSADRELND